MSSMYELDLKQPPAPGRHLVESGAGTGKTYSIAVLFCWYVVVYMENIDRILVVTFTEAATAELRERIFRFLKEAHHILADPTYQSDNEHISYMCREAIGNENALIHRLHVLHSLKNFDQVAVYTIHGFCRRILSQHAFETSSVIGSDFIEDESSIVSLLSSDYLKRTCYQADPVVYARMNGQYLSRGSLVSMYRQVQNRPDARIIPESRMHRVPDETALQLADAVRKACQELRAEWHQSRDDILTQLGTMEKFSGHYFAGKQFKSRDAQYYAELFDSFLDMPADISGILSNPLFTGLIQKFSLTPLQTKGMLKKYADDPPDHLFFVRCEELSNALDACDGHLSDNAGAFYASFIETLSTDLEQYKKERHMLYYNDLLTEVDRALASPRRKSLVASVGGLFSAVLIDEFQDTDPVQYRIFNTLFQHPGHAVFLIGDPKQAIYSFRGADIFTYLAASKTCTNRYLLSQNRRSHPGICAAVNSLFKRRHPFILDKITYSDAQATRNEYAAIDGTMLDPFVMKICSSQDKPYSTTAAKALCARSCADTVSQLVSCIDQNRLTVMCNGEHLRNLTPSDIAVLVRTRSEGSLVSRELQKRGVIAVEILPKYLHETYEFFEMRLLVHALARPHDRGAVHALLASRICGYTIDTLVSLSDRQDPEYDRLLEQIVAYSTAFSRQSFYDVLMRVFQRFHTVKRSLSLPGGERIYTNYMHIAEIVHAELLQKSRSAEGLLSWMNTWESDETMRSEHQQQRIESDDMAVRIMTIHKSKGLQFPVVFCPFHFSSSEVTMDSRNNALFYHDEQHAMICNLDPAADSDAALRASNEQLSENLRLLYVALTRAQYRCILYYGNIRNSATSAISYLLNRDLPGGDAAFSALQAHAEEIESAPLHEAVRNVCADGCCRIEECEEPSLVGVIPKEMKHVELAARKLHGTIDRSYRIASYSSLVSQYHTEDTHDISYHTADFPENSTLLPPGAQSGLLLHDVLEKIPFDADSTLRRTLCADILASYGYEKQYLADVESIVYGALDTTLPVADTALHAVPAENRSSEMEFYLSVSSYTPKQILDVISAFYPGYRTWSLRNAATRISGFLKGFIDLVFVQNGTYYIVDWKSNYLGHTADAYEREALSDAMYEHAYHIQYLLYCVALRRFLRIKLPVYTDDCLGGVYYLFLRGMKDDIGGGIYFDTPDSTVLDALEEVFDV